MKTEISSYEQQAIDFLNATGATIETKFLEHAPHFQDDKESRDIYEVKITRLGRKFVFKFGASLNDSGFYYTKGKRQITIDHSLIGTKNLASAIRAKDLDFLNNGKSDVIHYPKAPTAYSILACLTKSDPDTFENFCSEFCYDTDSRKAFKTYKAVKREWKNIERLFTPEQIEQLQEIN